MKSDLLVKHPLEMDHVLTAVHVSMHKTNGSENKYLESDSAYSFHN